MTLIVSLLSPTVIIQVSDRRLSMLHKGKTTPIDRPQNKAVIYEDRVAFGFAGLASLEGQSTDLWVAGVLARSATLSDGFDELRTALTDLFARRPYRGHLQTVAAAGYKYAEDGRRPFYALVTNHFRDGKWLPRAEPTFHWIVDVGPPRGMTLAQAPAWFTTREMKSMQRHLKRMGDRSLNAVTVIDYLSRAVRQVAAKHHEVGQDLMVTTLPLPPTERTDRILYVAGSPMPETPTFWYLNSD